MLALDVLLLLLISVCIGYCWILNRRIRDLHNSRLEFATMIKAFDTAIVKAEHCIADLSVLGKNATTQVKKASESASEVIEELKTVYAIGDKVGAKLEASIMDARKHQKSIEEAQKKRKQPYQNEEEYIDAKLEESEFVYEDFQYATNSSDSKVSDESDPVPQNILAKVFNTITTHKHKGKMDQNSYYDSLRKVNIRK